MTASRTRVGDFKAHTASLTVYGQTELIKDLMLACHGLGGPPLFEVDDVMLEGVESSWPSLRYRWAGAEHRLDCDVVPRLRWFSWRESQGDPGQCAEDP